MGALVAMLFLSTIPMPVRATEEPSYEVIREFSGIELRAYAAYTVAEVVVPGPAGEAGRQAFPILAGYIFGKNKGERKFDMTAPVTQTAAPVKMEMTTPVTQSVRADGFLVQFVLPKGVTVANAPEPLDSRIRLRDVSPYQVAVLRYSGFWSEANDNEHLLELQSALKASDLAWTGDPVFSKYDAPFKPWFLRRNEVWLRLAAP